MNLEMKTEEIYKDYWTGSKDHREKRRYYERLYSHVVSKIRIEDNSKVLDVAGGNGQNSIFLKLSQADILDISDSGLSQAEQYGFRPIKGDVQKRFPVEPESYDTALCFEVLEHLHYPNKTLAEINNVLKPGGVLYVGQPNMRPDGKIHVRRYYLQELVSDLNKCGFSIEWIDYVPAYTMPEAIWHDIRTNRSWLRKCIQCVNLTLSLLPWAIRYKMAQMVPNRFALIFVIKAIKKDA